MKASTEATLFYVVSLTFTIRYTFNKYHCQVPFPGREGGREDKSKQGLLTVYSRRSYLCVALEAKTPSYFKAYEEENTALCSFRVKTEEQMGRRETGWSGKRGRC